MRINIAAVLNKKPPVKEALPKVKIKNTLQPPVNRENFQYSMLQELEAEMTYLRKQRAKLSTRGYYLVEEVAAKMRKESAAAEEEFLKGNVPVPELAEHAAKIQAFTEHMMEVFDKIRHVEQYGQMPEVVKKEVVIGIDTDPAVNALRHQVRRLDDFIHKTNKKINGYKPKNPDRVLTWKEKVALAEIQRDDIKRKIKVLQYEARDKRAGE